MLKTFFPFPFSTEFCSLACLFYESTFFICCTTWNDCEQELLLLDGTDHMQCVPWKAKPLNTSFMAMQYLWNGCFNICEVNGWLVSVWSIVKLTKLLKLLIVYHILPHYLGFGGISK